MGDIGELGEIDEKFTEIGEEYQEAITPLREARNTARQTAQQSFSDYLSASLDNLGEFSIFLQDPNAKIERENIRPFLLLLSEYVKKGKPETYFDQVISLWKEKATKEANEEILRRYLETELKRSEENSSNGSSFFAGLRFGMELSRSVSHADQKPEGDSATSTIVDYLKANSWPEVIKSGYKMSLDARYSADIASARIALDQYRRLGEVFLGNGDIFEKESNKRRNRQWTARSKNKTGDNIRQEEEYRTAYRVLVLQENNLESRFSTLEMGEEELLLFMQKRAGKIAPHDQRMVEDIQAIVENLRNNPYGFGTKKTNDQVLAVGFRRYPVREFIPHKRGSSLTLSHELSNSLRVAYVVDDEQGTIMIEDIDKHGAFDRKLRKGI